MPNFTISQSTGTGVTTILVAPTGQNTTYSAKTATITISDGTSTKNVLVKQNGLPYTVPNMQAPFSDGSYTETAFTVVSDFIIQFSGDGSTWASIWDADSGEQLGPSDWFWPEDLTTAHFVLRIEANPAQSERQMQIKMKHYYNNAGTYELAPYEYTIWIYQDYQ